MTVPFTDPSKLHAHRAWQTLTGEEVEQLLQTGPQGLQDAQAAERLAQFGPNTLISPKRRGPLLRLLAQFHNILLYVLR